MGLRVDIEDWGEGVLGAHYEAHTYRFLFSDGTTVDVIAHRDDSDLRAAVMKFLHHGREIAIVGCATLEVDDAKPRP